MKLESVVEVGEAKSQGAQLEARIRVGVGYVYGSHLCRVESMHQEGQVPAWASVWCPHPRWTQDEVGSRALAWVRAQVARPSVERVREMEFVQV